MRHLLSPRFQWARMTRSLFGPWSLPCVIGQAGMRRANLVIALVALSASFVLSVDRRHAASPLAAAPEAGIALVPDVVLYGPAENTYLAVRAVADVNADGAADALLDYAVRLRGVQQDRQDILFGRADWPAEPVGLGDIEGMESLGLPTIGNDMSSRDGASFYGFRAFFDADGDGIEDLAAFEQTRSASEVRKEEIKVYLGGSDWSTPDIKRVRGAFSITQDQVPQEPHLAERNPMAEQVLAGDFDGDGDQDIAIVSCHVERGQEFEEGQTGTLRLYLSPEDGPENISLRGGAAHVVLTGEAGLAMGCFQAFAGDFDGDGVDDVLVTGSDLTQFGGSYAALLRGRDDWPSKADVADAADMRFTHDVERGGVRAVDARDLDGDGALEAVFEYGVGHQIAGYCAWSAALSMPANASAAACPLRFVDEMYYAAGDLDADGTLDLVFELPHRAGDEVPYRYAALRGPIVGDTVAVGDKKGSTLGDAVFEVPLEHDQAEWFVHDMNGDGVDDVVLSRDAASSPDGDEFAGRVELVFGPLLPPATLPSPTPTAGVEATATPNAPTPSPTATPQTPIATEIPGNPPVAIYLPLGLRNHALSAD